MLELIGWAGNIIFAISAVPQAWQCYLQGHGKGLAPGLLWMWFVGEGLALIYGFGKGLPTPVVANYLFNFICLLIILRYKYFLVSRNEKNPPIILVGYKKVCSLASSFLKKCRRSK